MAWHSKNRSKNVNLLSIKCKIIIWQSLIQLKYFTSGLKFKTMWIWSWSKITINNKVKKISFNNHKIILNFKTKTRVIIIKFKEEIRSST